MLDNNIKLSKTVHLIIIWLLLTSTAPFIFFRWPGHPYKILTLMLLILIISLLFLRRKIILFDSILIIIIAIQSVFYFFISLYHNDFSNFNLIVQLISLLFVILFINTFVNFNFFANSFINIILIMGVLGTIAFFLHALIGLNPLFTVQYGNDISFFLGITSTNVFINSAGIRILRYSGFFDEPGTYALFSLFAILINRLYFQNKRRENILILVSFFTFSIAFYISIFFYFILFNFKFKYLKYVLFILIIISFLFYEYRDKSDLVSKVYELTFDRLLSTKEGISNTNRADLYEKDFTIFVNNPFFGIGSNNKEIGGSNFFAIFARYGLLGAFFYYIHIVYLFYVILKSKNLNYLKFFLILLITLFYRPELSSLITLLCIYTMNINIQNNFNKIII